MFYFFLIPILIFFGYQTASILVFARLKKFPRQIVSPKINFSLDAKESYKKTLTQSKDPQPEWQPQELFGTFSQPVISGKSAILVDINTRKILYEKNSSQKLPIASLTKLMTAVVALEHKNLDDKFWVSQPSAYIGENTMTLTTGETYTFEELLYGLFLHSANDAAYVIAENTAEDIDTFVSWMNFKADDLGMKDTNLFDPSGLDNSNQSTVEDLVKLARYALKYDELKKIGATKQIELNGDKHKTVYLENQTNLIGTYPGVAGLKTGYTEEAGLCLITYAVYDGHALVGVVLGSNDRKGDMILMLDHGFSSLGVKIEHNLIPDF